MTRRPPASRARPTNRVPIVRVRDGTVASRRDVVAGEEPVEIRVVAGGRTESVAITMRTPGHDFELAAGFLFAEGVVAARDEVRAIRYCSQVDEDQRFNVVDVHLKRPDLPPLERLERHFTMSSACGVCGKAHLDALAVRCEGPLPGGPRIDAATLAALPDKLRAAQAVFGSTGGLHAAALLTSDGQLIALREDVGRHNAMDKLIGHALLEDRLDLDAVICVSGRASYELVQKALAARIAFFAAISAPSSLAVDLAKRFGVTLVGFLRVGGFNVYAGTERIERLEGRRLPARRYGTNLSSPSRTPIVYTNRRANMRSVDVREVRDGLLLMLRAVAGGEEIVIERRGRPAARLVPPVPGMTPFRDRASLGCARGRTRAEHATRLREGAPRHAPPRLSAISVCPR